ncbi:galactoside permease [Actinobacillus equuli]|nr:galactoside permease [Actinobacillus equuli]
MATCYPFLGIWLGDINGLTGEERGIVFAAMSFFALCFQPIFGYVTDKLGVKKHMLWAVAIALLFYAPFFIYVFAPMLKPIFGWGLSLAGFIWDSCFPVAPARLRLM